MHVRRNLIPCLCWLNLDTSIRSACHCWLGGERCWCDCVHGEYGPLHFHEIIHSMEHIFTRESRVWLEFQSTSLHLPSTRHGFVDAVQIQGIGIKIDNIGAGSSGFVPDKSATHLSISGKSNISNNVLLDCVVEIFVFKLNQTKVDFVIVCCLE